MEIPKGQKCELCGMLSERVYKDHMGVTHYYCAYHQAANSQLTSGKQKGHSSNIFRDRFWVSLILTIPVLLYAQSIQRWFHFGMPAFPGSQWIPFVFGTAIFFYGGTVFLKSAWGELKSRLPGMMTLSSM